MHLLLTGGTGFLGRAFLRYLLYDQPTDLLSLTLITRSPERFLASFPRLARHPFLEIVRADLLEASSLNLPANYTHVVHAAADSTAGPSFSPVDRFLRSSQATRNILDLAARLHIGRFLYLSSGAVYGPLAEGNYAYSEDYPFSPSLANPHSAYGQAKRFNEHLCHLYRNSFGFELVIARCFSFVGRDLPLDAHYAIGNFINQALYSDSITVLGDGTAVRTYMDQRDLSRWLWQLLVNSPDAETFNIGSDRPITISELAHLVRDLLAPHVHIVMLNQPLLSSGRSVYVPDVSKARSILGLDLSYDISESILHSVLARLSNHHE